MTPTPLQISVFPNASPSDPGCDVNHIACPGRGREEEREREGGREGEGGRKGGRKGGRRVLTRTHNSYCSHQTIGSSLEPSSDS